MHVLDGQGVDAGAVVELGLAGGLVDHLLHAAGVGRGARQGGHVDHGDDGLLLTKDRGERPGHGVSLPSTRPNNNDRLFYQRFRDAIRIK